MNIIAKDKVLFSLYECLFGLVRTFYTFSHNQRECAEILHFDTLSTKFIYKLKSVFRPYHLYLVPFAIWTTFVVLTIVSMDDVSTHTGDALGHGASPAVGEFHSIASQHHWEDGHEKPHCEDNDYEADDEHRCDGPHNERKRYAEEMQERYPHVL